MVADEGMWLLSLLKKQEAAMQAKGLKLTAEEIYNVNNTSLKDAIVWFNGGCTGEIISSQGLVLTNHHCGEDAITSLSTPEDNILDSGFYAKTKAEERKPIKPLFVSILVKVEDVTAKVYANLEASTNEKERDSILKKLSETFKKEYAGENTTLEVRLQEMFKGNQYFVFVYEKFTDIRLVGTPTKSVGKYGDITDNWMWPRHTGDFSLFRIYANKDNKPAAYSEDNVPYKPKHHLPVSLKGVKENDFAMILGFPGRTNRYDFADAIQLSLDETNMSIVNLREIRLSEWRKVMDNDIKTRLELSSNFSRVANYWKYFIGATEQLKRLKVVDAKKEEERQFQSWANNKEEYKNILSSVKVEVDNFRPYAKHLQYIREGVLTPEIMQVAGFAYRINSQIEQGDKIKKEVLESTIAAFQEYVDTRNWNPLLWESDQRIFARILYKYYTDISKDQQPELLEKIAKKYKFDTAGEEGARKFTADFYKKSMLSNKTAASKFASKLTAKSIKKDPAFQLFSMFIDVYENLINPKNTAYLSQMKVLGRTYMKGLMEMQPERNFYSDANSNIRLTYGSVKGYNSRDAVYYGYKTTMEGVLQKYIPGDIEFNLTDRFLTLARSKKYGKYADSEGNLIVNMLTDNDITGGNSGSPVMNGEGHLIGLAFDGNWEAMSGDIYYDDTYKRTINVDIRYVLWCIDVLGEASHIINEMTIIK